MTEIDRLRQERDKFRKAYEAEVRASAESKRRSAEHVEWAEQQRQAAVASHAGQIRNTIAFKAEVDLLVDALRTLDTLLDFGDDDLSHTWEFEDLTSIKEAFAKAKGALAAVKGAGQ